MRFQRSLALQCLTERRTWDLHGGTPVYTWTGVGATETRSFASKVVQMLYNIVSRVMSPETSVTIILGAKIRLVSCFVSCSDKELPIFERRMHDWQIWLRGVDRFTGPTVQLEADLVGILRLQNET